MKSAAAAGLVVAALAVAGGVAFLVLSDGAPAPAPVRKTPKAAAKDPGDPPVKAAVPAEPPEPPARKMPDPGPEPVLASEEPEPGAGLVFSFSDSDTTFAGEVGLADWRRAGVHLRRSLLAKVRYVAALRRGDSTAPVILGEARMQQGGFLPATAPLLLKLGPSETAASMEMLITHPVVVGNALAGTLAAMNRPLTPEQVAKMQPLLVAALLDERQLRTANDPDTWWIERRLAKSAVREKLFVALREALDEDQRALACPPELRDRAGLDVFSAVTLWEKILQQPPVGDEAWALPQGYWEAVIIPSGTKGKNLKPLREWIGEKWTERGADRLPMANDLLSRDGHFTLAFLLACANETLHYGRLAHEEAKLDPPDLARMKQGVVRILVPGNVSH